MAVRLFRRGCDLGAAEACNDLGVMQATANGTGQDDVSARQLFERACDRASMLGCFNLSVMLKQGRGGPANVPHSQLLLEHACGLGHGGACYNRALELFESRPDLSALYERRGCQLGVGRACRGEQIAQDNRRENRRNPLRALEVEQADCAAGRARACNQAGWLMSIRTSPQWNLAASIASFRRGCDLGANTPCYNLGTLLAETATDNSGYARAREAWSKGCSRGHRLACALLADSWVSSGEGVSRPDYAYATVIWDWLCAVGEGEACTEAGAVRRDALVVLAPTDPTPTEQFRQGCARGSPFGCLQYAVQLRQSGKGQSALAVVRRACRRGHAPSCRQWSEWLPVASPPLEARRRATILRLGCQADPLDAVACRRPLTPPPAWPASPVPRQSQPDARLNPAGGLR
jgi:uncharacterized protein